MDPKRMVWLYFSIPNLYMKLKLEALRGNTVIYRIGDTDMKSFLQAACLSAQLAGEPGI